MRCSTPVDLTKFTLSGDAVSGLPYYDTPDELFSSSGINFVPATYAFNLADDGRAFKRRWPDTRELTFTFIEFYNNVIIQHTRPVRLSLEKSELAVFDWNVIICALTPYDVVSLPGMSIGLAHKHKIEAASTYLMQKIEVNGSTTIQYHGAGSGRARRHSMKIKSDEARFATADGQFNDLTETLDVRVIDAYNCSLQRNDRNQLHGVVTEYADSATVIVTDANDAEAMIIACQDKDKCALKKARFLDVLSYDISTSERVTL